jgi:hypothetical protein
MSALRILAGKFEGNNHVHEFVDHERLKTVRQGVEVVNPEEPSLHGEDWMFNRMVSWLSGTFSHGKTALTWNHVTGVDDHERDQEGCQSGGHVVICKRCKSH